MPNIIRPYSLEKALSEASEMLYKIGNKKAKDYSEAEKQVEEAQVETLKEALDWVDRLENGKIGNEISNLPYLMQEKHPSLVEPALKVGLQNLFNAIQKMPKDDRITISEIGHQSAYVGYLLHRDLHSNIFDPTLIEIGVRIIHLRAKYQEWNRAYQSAKENYESIGLTDKAEEMQKLYIQFPDSMDACKKLGQDHNIIIDEIGNFQDYTKQHPLITEEVKIQILKKIREAIQADLDDLKTQ